MNSSLAILFAFGIVLANAFPFPNVIPYRNPKIADGTPAENAPHACILITVTATGTFTLGGASIISHHRVVTATHVVRGGTQFQLGYYDIVTGDLIRADSVIAQHANEFNPLTHENDIAVIVFPDDTFPTEYHITIANPPALTTASVCTLTSFGFVGPDSTTVADRAYSAAQTYVGIGEECSAALNLTPKHLCAIDTTATVCAGDNGSGLYITEAGTNILVGITSVIVPGCFTPAQTGYTIVSEFQSFLELNGAGEYIPEVTTADPGTTEDPAGTTEDPAGTTEDPAGTTEDPAATASS